MYTPENYNNLYAFKNIPDVFYCNENGEVLYFSKTAKSVEFTYNKNFSNRWTLTVTDTVGNEIDFFKLQKDICNGTITDVYLRSTHRSTSDGEDYPLCLKIKVYKLGDIKCGTYSDGELFKFILPILYTQTPELVDDANCPNYVNENGKFYVTNA